MGIYLVAEGETTMKEHPNQLHINAYFFLLIYT